MRRSAEHVVHQITSHALAATFAVALAAGSALAQTPATAPATPPAPAAAPPGSRVVAVSRVPQRDALARLVRPISIDFRERRLEDALQNIHDQTGADFEVMWADDVNNEGLDKETLVTAKMDNATGLAALERVLAAGRTDFGENTWQMTDTGTIQVGPKKRLNRHRRLAIYDIHDLLTDLPSYPDVPTIDLQQALRQTSGGRGGGGGGGSGSGPFRNQQQLNQVKTQQQLQQEREARVNELLELIRNVVETEQWIESGGDAASMRFYQGQLIVNAPDYVHRGLNGYPYWPAAGTRMAMVKKQRYVTFTGDTGISTIKDIRQIEASAVVGGQIIKSGPGGGR